MTVWNRRLPASLDIATCTPSTALLGATNRMRTRRPWRCFFSTVGRS